MAKVAKKAAVAEKAAVVEKPEVVKAPKDKSSAFLVELKALSARVEGVRPAVVNRELSLALVSVADALDQAARWAKFADEAIKVNKLDVTL